jgi:hypothetical protein
MNRAGGYAKIAAENVARMQAQSEKDSAYIEWLTRMADVAGLNAAEQLRMKRVFDAQRHFGSISADKKRE